MKRSVALVWLCLLVLFGGLLCWRLTQTGWLSLPNNGGARVTSYSEQQPVAPTATPTPHRPGFETGVVFPQWGHHAYGTTSGTWHAGLSEIKSTHARWIEITIPLHMTSAYSTIVETRTDTPSLQSFRQGLQTTHKQGFSILVEPLITLDGSESWAGYIQFLTEPYANTWFNSYQQVLKPFLTVVASEHVEEFSLGNEYDLLEDEFPDLWDQLLEQVHTSFNGKIIYSVNWASLKKPLPSWFSNPLLNIVGVSCYFSLTTTSQRLSNSQALAAWKQNDQHVLDNLAQQTGKPVLLTEVGYPDVSDGGYLPYQAQRTTARDDQEQAILYNATIEVASSDPSIIGTFWWAWSVAPFAPNGKLAEQVLHKWYSYL